MASTYGSKGSKDTLSKNSDQENKTATARPIERISVLGAGTMGHGIAQVAAAAGYDVVMRDIDDAAVQRGLGAIERNLAKGVERGKVSEAEREQALQRIRVTTDIAEVRDSDLVIEAAPEKLELKQNLLRETDALVESRCIFATNTSSLSITEISKASARPGNVIGMHFFNPVHIMRLIEIVVGGETSDETTVAVRTVAERMKKEPIVVRDVPGFASSRLGVTLGLEAMRMVEQGVASARDIDKAMELGYNHPVGPLKLTDMVGLDVRLSIAEYLHHALKSETFRPPDILRQMVSEGKLGKKTGEGFYKWNEPEQAQRAYTG
jgi:3-hydroxybutyryl-CoA dehydrogenase